MAYTKKIYLKAIVNYFNENEVVIPANTIEGEGELQDDIKSEDIKKFATHEIELLSKKNSSNKLTKTQQENEEVKNAIIESLRKIGKAVTITELQTSDEKMKTYSNQKLSALLKQLVETKEVVKSTDKKKSKFSISEQAEMLGRWRP